MIKDALTRRAHGLAAPGEPYALATAVRAHGASAGDDGLATAEQERTAVALAG